MRDGGQPADPPQDTGPPDPVERDGAALSAAEDLDEDRLAADPLEEALDPPEHYSGVNKWGTTPFEESQGEPLDSKLRAEQPDVQP
ncbi:hypothetical protein [Actinophytocola sp.]|jgi:hypothetical protein|uniref:hypothetical protein n=1 Tax=Actinophytocola sp. TaxID=1872138 RepID=UPI0039C898D7